MGGNAFASRGLQTPRMSPAVYNWARDECHRKLRQMYLCVATPIEGPGKEDFGDVDLFVALEKRAFFPQNELDQTLPHPRFGQDVLADIGKQLGAEHVVYLPHSRSANLAIPWPEHMLAQTLTTDRESGETEMIEGGPAPVYIQVDVEIKSSVDELLWHLFKHAHGDIWHMIGVIIRPLGLTVDEEALWLRIPELESVNKKASKVKLTSEPIEVLKFLGFSGQGQTVEDADLADDDGSSLFLAWSQPFASVDAMFGYLTTCRWFFQINPPERKAGNGDGTTSLRHNDRRRMATRPLFAKWSNDFIPQLQAEGRFDQVRPVQEVRDEVRVEAFDYFPGAKEDYLSRLGHYLGQRSKEIVLKDIIKVVVPADLEVSRRSVAVSALKKIILEDNDTFGIMPAEPLKDRYGIYDHEMTKRWAEDNWEEVLDKAWRINQVRCAIAMEKKELKRKMDLEEQEQQQVKV